MKSKEQIDYEERVKRRVLILKDLLEEGKITVAEHLAKGLQESLSKVKFDENGEPDVETIDGRIRSMALMAEHYDYREKMKGAISLYQIQENYFKRFELNFMDFYNAMLDQNLTSHQVAEFVAYNHTNDYIDNAIEPIIEDLNEFWNTVAETGYYHLQDQEKTVKAVFGGDLFPANNENIASKCGIYTDTIILPCPIIRSRHMFKVWNKQQRIYYLIKHALNILQYKDLALAEIDKPIVVILADKEMIDDSAFEQIQKLGERDALYHAEKVFGRKFSSMEELIGFGKDLDTVDKVIKEIKNPDKVLFDTEFKDPLSIQIEQQITGQSGQLMQTNNPGIIVSMLGLGRMSVSNELLFKSAKVGGGVPLIDAPTSWQYFKWKLEYDGDRTAHNLNLPNSHILQGLNSLSSTKLQWIGKIPPEGLIEIRKSGAIDEIRKILSNEIDEMVLANSLDYEKTAKKVLNNLNDAFEKHQKNIRELTSKKWKIAGKDFGSWLVMGSLEIASAYTGTPLYGISTAVLSQIIDAPKLKDLPKTVKTIKEIEKEKQNLSKSPVGLMFKYK
ncbi:hypothetical protein H0S70_01570 [Chryseobacterium manosquense]|uniref:Uncharacterized protein n=1 Tax=Chryseobacterium manosquense TaxID=2754694 RepID=A0A7H1DXK2_9FLAO|nr:hypothetical protein [Chryseobacterium manosquense]QNS41710.1 hypothetical protein H0S70_01570 [Chryseobacterium manosquense]